MSARKSKSRSKHQIITPDDEDDSDNSFYSNKPYIGVGNLKPSSFTGDVSEDPELWLEKFEAWRQLSRLSDSDTPHVFRLMLDGRAVQWYKSLTEGDRKSRKTLYEKFLTHFKSAQQPWIWEKKLFERVMGEGENLENYITDIEQKCSKLDKPDPEKMRVFVRGLLPHLRTFVIQQQPKTCQEAIQAARIASESIAYGGDPFAKPESQAGSAMDTLQKQVNKQEQTMSYMLDILLSMKTKDTTSLPVNVISSGNSYLDVSSTVCQLCYEQGHSARACPGFMKKPMSKIICRKCKQPGHFESSCSLN